MRLTKLDWQIINAALAMYEASSTDGDRGDEHTDEMITSTRSRVHERLRQYSDPYGENT